MLSRVRSYFVCEHCVFLVMCPRNDNYFPMCANSVFSTSYFDYRSSKNSSTFLLYLFCATALFWKIVELEGYNIGLSQLLTQTLQCRTKIECDCVTLLTYYLTFSLKTTITWFIADDKFVYFTLSKNRNHENRRRRYYFQQKYLSGLGRTKALEWISRQKLETLKTRVKAACARKVINARKISHKIQQCK